MWLGYISDIEVSWGIPYPHSLGSGCTNSQKAEASSSRACPLIYIIVCSSE